MAHSLSILSDYVFAAAYGVTAVLCMVAGLAGSQADRTGVRWKAIAVVFSILAALRFTHSEKLLQNAAREWLKTLGTYQDRSTVQALIGLAVTVALALAIVRICSCAPREHKQIGHPHLLVALLLFVIILRWVSWHPTDRLLYTAIGPIHFNHLLDGGLTFVISMLGITQIRHIRHKRAPR